MARTLTSRQQKSQLLKLFYFRFEHNECHIFGRKLNLICPYIIITLGILISQKYIFKNPGAVYSETMIATMLEIFTLIATLIVV